jgi:multiple sugar transport system substrate-binding protein
MKRTVSLTALLALALPLAPAAAQAEALFWSTQAKPVEESQAMREQVLAGFEGGVDYQGMDNGPWLTRIQAEMQAGTGTIALLGGLHGDLSGLEDGLMDLSSVDTAGIGESMLELGTLGTGEQKYIPWMQATYLMAANRKALEHLPEGADLNALTYDQLIAWAAPSTKATGGPKFGFPAGPQGLKHRFFQGFLLPAYTSSTVTEFRSKPPWRPGRRSSRSGRRPPRRPRLQLHAGAAPDRGGLDRLRPRRAAGRGVQPAPRRLRGLPGARRSRRAGPSCRCSPVSR